jgi:hypothetical protein
VGWLAVALSAFLVEPSFAGPALKITPQYSLVDEPLRILADGLEPGQEFTVRAVLRMSAQNMLGSYGRFRTDEKGQADIEKQVPQGGTYHQGGMGLLWSMTKDALPEDAKDMELPFPANVGDPYTRRPGNGSRARHVARLKGLRRSGCGADRWIQANDGRAPAPRSSSTDLVLCPHLSFPDAGHIINFPYMPAATRTQLGGTVEGLAHADAESWKRVLAFLATTLGQTEVRR